MKVEWYIELCAHLTIDKSVSFCKYNRIFTMWISVHATECFILVATFNVIKYECVTKKKEEKDLIQPC